MAYDDKDFDSVICPYCKIDKTEEANRPGDDHWTAKAVVWACDSEECVDGLNICNTYPVRDWLIPKHIHKWKEKLENV